MTKEERLINEKKRIAEMYRQERKTGGNADFIFGIDEAGRGPLCGPVVAACCLLPENCEILYLNDSKKLSEKRRNQVYDDVLKNCLAYGVGMAGPERIDEINILNATYEAMTDAFNRCIEMLDRKGSPFGLMKDMSIVLVDGNKTVPSIKSRQISVIGGDALCPSIAAASCIAKVTRDRLMYSYAKEYPEYGFDKNKGYGTREHIEALRNSGALPIHRKTFIKNFI